MQQEEAPLGDNHQPTPAKYQLTGQPRAPLDIPVNTYGLHDVSQAVLRDYDDANDWRQHPNFRDRAATRLRGSMEQLRRALGKS